MDSRSDLHRHSLVWLQPSRRRGGNTADGADISGWILLGRPFVIRRRIPEDLADHIPLGLSLPLSQGKRRLTLNAPLSDIVRLASPPRLSQVIESTNATLRNSLECLLEKARSADITFRTFGSLAWQWLTGAQYLTSCSDIDLLAKPKDEEQLFTIIDILSAWEKVTGFKADGEIMFTGGQAVAWRELMHPGPSHLLVKSNHAVYLEKYSVMMNQLSAPQEEHAS